MSVSIFCWFMCGFARREYVRRIENNNLGEGLAASPTGKSYE